MTNVSYPARDQAIGGLLVLAEQDLTGEVISRIHDVIGEAGAGLALLSRSATGDWHRSSDDPAPAVFLTDPLHHVTNLTQAFRTAFDHIEPGGFLICRLETTEQRKQRLISGLPAGLTSLRYMGDFLLHRVAPRLPVSRSVYHAFFPTVRTVSKAEALGRLYHAGYSVSHTVEADGRLTIIARRPERAYVERPASSEGILLRMWRVGQGERPFCVFKFRTMHPYSEYLQEYLMQTDGLEAGGKFRNDFRVTTLGRWMRKCWIDELPMLINVLRGEMKWVGVRPLSGQYFSLYPEDIQRERCRHKPGLLPPYYADMPKTFTEIVDSERRYLRAYEQAPIRTDWSYLFKIGYNIIWKRVSSK